MDHPQVLIIDDNPDTCLFYRSILGLDGIGAVVANSAKAGLLRLAISQPDLVLLDMRLRSEIGGEDILIQIRNNPRLERTQVIVVTAFPELADPVKNMADLILYKPIEVKQLRDLSNRLLSERSNAPLKSDLDPETELCNRAFYLMRLEQAVKRAKRRSDYLFATLYFTYTSAEPDEPELSPDEREQAMKQVAYRLRTSFRPTDTLARWNEEHFATLHEGLKHPDNVNVLVSRLEGELRTPCRIGDRPRRLAPRFGAIMHSRQYAESDAILNFARQSRETLSFNSALPPSENLGFSDSITPHLPLG